jgi:hypothetical protein
MSKIRLHGSSSGYTEIAPVAASGNNTLTLPNDGTIISQDSNGAVGVTSITVGTGVTIGDGRVTCSTLHGSAANCTQIPAANIVGVCTAGFSRTGGFGGITMADQWRVNSAFNSQNETLSFNWERNDTDFAQIGTGMTYNSGIWTFPQTGIYHVEFCMAMYLNSEIRYMGGQIQATTDNSSYTNRADGYTAVSNYSSSGYVGRELTMIFDVTDTSTHKIRFRSDSGTTVTYDGSSTSNRTYATFIRLGDT